MSITKASIPSIRRDIDKALAAVEAKHNIKFNFGRITYETGVNFRGKLEAVATNDRCGNSVDPAQVNFERNAMFVGVKKDAFGQKFTSNRKQFTITGINTRAKKYPIQGETANGRRYKFPVSQLPASLRA